MTEFGQPDTGIPVPIRAEGETKGRFLREDWKNNLIDAGVALYKSGKFPSIRQVSKDIAPDYYRDWHDIPDMQPERIKTLSRYIRDRLNK